MTTIGTSAHPRAFGFLRLTSEPMILRTTSRDAHGTLTESVWRRHDWEAPDGCRISVDADVPLIRRLSIDDATPAHLTALAVGYGDTIRSSNGRWLFEAVNPPGVPPLHCGCPSR